MNKRVPLLLALALAGVVLGSLFFWLGGGEAPADAVATSNRGAAEAAIPRPSGPLADASAVATGTTLPAGTGDQAGRRELAPRGALTPATAAAEPVDDGPRLRGRVVDDAGRGVAGAKVTFTANASMGGPASVRVLGAVFNATRSGETDPSGRYAIEPPGVSEVDIKVSAAGFAPLLVEDFTLPENREQGLEDLALSPGAILQGLVVDDGGVTLAGAELRLLDPESDSFFFTMGDAQPADAVSDAGGSFRLDRLAIGPWMVRVSAEGHPPRVFRGSTERAGVHSPSLRLELPRGVTLSGRAVGVPEALRSEVRVRAAPEGAQAFAVIASGGAFEAPVGEDGSFQVEGLEPDREYSVELVQQGQGMMAMMGAGASRSPKVTARSGTTGVELQFRPPAAVRFTVVDAATGAPVVQFEAKLGFAFNQRTLNDAEGEPLRFHPGGEAAFTDLYGADFDMFGESALRLRVDAEGYGSATREIADLEEGESRDLGRIELRPAPPVRVRVVAAGSGKPIGNARVELRPLSVEGEDEDGGVAFMMRMDLANQTRRAKTGDDGRAEVTSIPDRPCRLSVDKGGYAPFVKADVVVTNSPLEFTVELGEGGEVSVFVVDRNGAEVPGAEVQHRGPGDEEVRGTRSTSQRRGARFRNLEPGDHSFRVAEDAGDPRNRWRRPRDQQADDAWRSVRVTHGGQAEVTLVVEATNAAFGLVRQGGRPLAGATVKVVALDEDGDGGPAVARAGGTGSPRNQRLDRLRTGSDPAWGAPSARSEADGGWRIDGLEPGEFALVVEHESRAQPHVQTFELVSSERRVDVDLPLCVVRGRVVDPEGRPVAGVTVEAELAGSNGDRNRWGGRGGGFNFLRSTGVEVVEVGGARGGAGALAPEEGVTGRDGTFELRGLTPAVSLQLRASADFVVSGVSESFELEVDEAREDFEIVVRPGATLVVTVRIAGEEENGFRFASVEATPIGFPPPAPVAEGAPAPPGVPEPVTAFSFGGSAARLEGLAPGRWSVVATLRGRDEQRASVPVEVEVSGGQVRELELLIP
jgi:hypothetical protein